VLGAAIDGSTGCGRYAASCAELSAPGTWIVNVALLVLLFALPRVAGWSAHGAIAVVLAGIPTAIALSAAGGSNVRDQSGPILLGILGLAYLIGVLYGVLMPRLNARQPT
jgi:hypothetical protein